ncbi:MAG: DUF4275 family protein [Pseudomonadota bacterium]
MDRRIEKFLENQEVTFELLDTASKNEVEKRWLREFARNVKKETGSWIYRRFKWHAYSGKFEAATEGQKALELYQDQWAAPYFVFDEEGTWSYRCKSERYPDFTVLRSDIYVVHHNMKWTMVFTHEQPHDGPYFAIRR